MSTLQTSPSFSICSSCNAFRSCRWTFSGDQMGDNPKIIVIGSQSDYREDIKQNLMYSPDFMMFAKANKGEYDYYYTKLVKCYTPSDMIMDDGIARNPTQIEVDKCSTILQMELKKYPDIDRVMVLGATAFYYFCGREANFLDSVGKIIEVEKWGRKLKVS